MPLSDRGSKGVDVIFLGATCPGHSSVVERGICFAEVTGSIPVDWVETCHYYLLLIVPSLPGLTLDIWYQKP